MATKSLTYENAMKRLEQIVSQIENNELNIEALPKVQKGAKGAASLKVRVNSGIQAGNFSLVR